MLQDILHCMLVAHSPGIERIIAVRDRRNGTVAFYDCDGKKLTERRERRISMPFTLTNRVLFHKRKVYIPAGRCGIYFR